MLNFFSLSQLFCVVIALSVSLHVFPVQAEGSSASTVNTELPSNINSELARPADKSNAQLTTVQPPTIQKTKNPEASVQEARVPETITQETSVWETRAQETKAQETKAQETKAQETKAQETRTQEKGTPEKSPQVGKHISSDIDLFSMLTSLLVVIAVIFFSAILLKRFQLNQPINGGMKIVSSLSLGTKERLVVVQAGEKQLVIGVTPHNINLVSELDEPLLSVGDIKKANQSQKKPNNAFAEILKNNLFSNRKQTPYR